MMAKDGWLKAAMTEDTMVAELLVRIKQGHALAPIKPTAVDLPPPRWGVRYPRSRLAFTCSPIKGVDYRRNSPKTPLSWTTGTTSSSGTADGFDDTDLPGCGSSRSKSFEEERTRQLVEEEGEMVILKNACLNDEERGGRNGRVIIKKRMKLDLGGGCTADKYNDTTLNNTQRWMSSSPLQHASFRCGAESLPPQVVLNKKKKESGYVVMLPDLNLMPNGEDYSEYHA